jgi:hypothetical protein
VHPCDSNLAFAGRYASPLTSVFGRIHG